MRLQWLRFEHRHELTLRNACSCLPPHHGHAGPSSSLIGCAAAARRRQRRCVGGLAGSAAQHCSQLMQCRLAACGCPGALPPTRGPLFPTTAGPGQALGQEEVDAVAGIVGERVLATRGGSATAAITAGGGNLKSALGFNTESPCGCMHACKHRIMGRRELYAEQAAAGSGKKQQEATSD